jgi:hypothetical protein
MVRVFVVSRRRIWKVAIPESEPTMRGVRAGAATGAEPVMGS